MRRAAVALAAIGTAFAIGILVGRAIHTHRSTRTVTQQAHPQSGAIPSTFSGEFDPHDVPLQELIPESGRLHSARVVPAAAGIPPEIVVTWDDVLENGPPSLAVWQRRAGFVAAWRRIYVREATESSPFRTLKTTTGDVTGDGHEDLLVFEDEDGSGGWGTYRLLAVFSGSIRQLYVRRASSDWTTIRLARRALVVSDGIGKDPRSGTYIHCCPRLIRTRLERWNGRALVDVSVTTRRADNRLRLP